MFQDKDCNSSLVPRSFDFSDHDLLCSVQPAVCVFMISSSHLKRNPHLRNQVLSTRCDTANGLRTMGTLFGWTDQTGNPTPVPLVRGGGRFDVMLTTQAWVRPRVRRT